MKISIIFASLYGVIQLSLCNLNQNNSSNGSFSPLSKIHYKDSTIVKEIVGNWVAVNKDTIDSNIIISTLTLNIFESNDSILGQYVNILGNGSEINAGDSSDYAFRMSKKDAFNVLKNQLYFPINNWEGGPTESDRIAYLKLRYNKSNDLLIWQLKTESKRLPIYTVLHRDADR